MADMEKLKKLLLAVALIGQVVGIVLLFFNVLLAVIFYILYGMAIIALFIVLIMERDKEKEEDDKSDYSDY
jgi:ABC-type transport system involved in cytochrome bd biosynthesis fused ATPase/permease subunit